jgi:hypothetical protein
MRGITDQDGNELFNFMEVLTVGVELAAGWGQLRIPPGHSVTVANWKVVASVAVGEPGIVAFAPMKEGDAQFTLDGCSFSQNSIVGLVRWVVATVDEAAANR